MVSLHYNITKEDYISFYTHVFWEEGKKKRRLNFLKQGGFLIVFLIVLYFAGGMGSFNNFSIAIYALIFVSTLLPLISGKASIIRNAEKITENPENSSLFTEYHLTATDAEMIIKNTFTETKYFWKAFIKKTETDTHYFLFENSLQAIIIPKSVCKSEQEKLALKKILSRNLSMDAEFNQILT